MNGPQYEVSDMIESQSSHRSLREAQDRPQRRGTWIIVCLAVISLVAGAAGAFVVAVVAKNDESGNGNRNVDEETVPDVAPADPTPSPVLLEVPQTESPAKAPANETVPDVAPVDSTPSPVALEVTQSLESQTQSPAKTPTNESTKMPVPSPLPTNEPEFIQLPQILCPPTPPDVACGRPFRDSEGTEVAADVSVCHDDASLWSASLDLSISRETNKGITYSFTVNTGHQAQDWTERAVGEHASIASFAAFTIALMSNQAPPDLIRDSLQAALDELGHAETSFEMASLLMGASGNHQLLEPGVLPASKLVFDNNMTALALGAAQEGCVQETLSALEMAVEVDEWTEAHGAREDGHQMGSDISELLMDKTRTIALEEGRHSALSWRTIHWVCQNDAEACHAARGKLLEPVHLADAIKPDLHRSSAGSRKIKRAWAHIQKNLVPFVTMEEEHRTLTDCTSASSSATDGLTWLLVDNIVRGVQCIDQKALA